MTSSGSPSPDVPGDAPALDAGAVLRLHRDPETFIGFGHKPDPSTAGEDAGRLRHVGSIKARDLVESLPGLEPLVGHDGYMTVNSYHKPAPWINSRTGLPDVWRKPHNLQHLNACFSDIDCGRPESDEPGAALTYEQVLTPIAEAVRDGVIPPPSIVGRSGRGAYLLWLLYDPKVPNRPQRAYRELVPIYQGVNEEIGRRLRARGLPADKHTTDTARFFRIPGSIHRKAGRRVEYWFPAGGDARGFLYNLEELARFLNQSAPAVSLPDKVRIIAEVSSPFRKTINKGSAPNRANGPRAMNARRATDMLLIQAHRHGFLKKGKAYDDGTISTGRRIAITLYSMFLFGTDISMEEARPAVLDMARNARPPLGDLDDDQQPEDILKAVYEPGGTKRWPTEKLCSILKITPDLARRLDLKTIVPKEVREERKAAMPKQADKIAQRREFVRRYVEEHGGNVPSCRKVRDALIAAGFPGGNHETANQILNELGFKDQRINKGGRPRKKITPLLEGYEGMKV